jgi:methylated-DNA-[protein]-cysteine S-methyltransferase
MDAPFRFAIELPEHGLVVGVRHDGRALLGVELGRRRKARAVSSPRCKVGRRFEADVRRYFAGGRVAFRFPLASGRGTPFQRAVWRALRRIPYGEVRTYGWVARAIGRPGAARAVGGACGANPWPIVVPCHRVVASNGLGGYSAGLEWKRLLLGIEGALPPE